MSAINKQRAIQLLIGILGVYTIYSLFGIIQEKLIKSKYYNHITKIYQNIDNPYAPLLFIGMFSYSLGKIYNFYKYPPQQRNIIPWIHGIKCGFAVVSSTITYSYAIYFTNFPVVMMIRSCNLLSVALVGVLFTGVNDTTLKLGKDRILLALIVTVGMIIFKAMDPNSSIQQHKAQFLGIVLMIFSLLADGFLPDFQAVMKQRIKPHPTVSMVQVNKWTTLLTLGFLIITGDLLSWFRAILTHMDYLKDLILTGILSFIGQIVIYRLVKQFKQHIVPFILTTRKIFTVVLSILYSNHEYNYWQVLGILIVFGASFYEFLRQIGKDNQQKNMQQLQKKQN